MVRWGWGLGKNQNYKDPSVRSHGMLAMIMVNPAKSWLTMVPLSRSWLIMTHGTLAKCFGGSSQADPEKLKDRV